MLILGIIMNGVSEGSGRQIWSYQGRVRDYVRTTNWKIAFDVCDLRSAAARNHLQQSRLETRAWMPANVASSRCAGDAKQTFTFFFFLTCIPRLIFSPLHLLVRLLPLRLFAARTQSEMGSFA